MRPHQEGQLKMRLILRALPALGLLACGGFAAADITGPTPLAWRWAESAKLSPSGTPQFYGDNVIVAVGGRIYSLNKETGNLNWRYPSGEAIAGTFIGGCTLAGDTVYAAGDEKSVYAVDAKTGGLKWQFLATQPITSNVVVAGKTVAFVGNKQELTLVNSADGTAIGNPYKDQSLIHDFIAAYGDQVIFSTQRGRIVSFDTSSNRPKWDQQLASLKPSGNFTVFNDRIYVNSSSYLIALRASSGSSIWQQNVGRELTGMPAANDSAIASVSANGELYIFNTNGRQAFGKPTPIGVPVGSPSFIGGMVNISTANGAINLVDPKSGTLAWSYVIAPIVSGQTVNNAAAPSGGNDKDGGGGGDAGFGGGAAGLGGAQNAATTTPQKVDYTLVAGMPAMSGNSLFVLTRDASLLMFDKDLGVDLTPPTVELLWPTPGNIIAGKAPMEMIFKLEDLGIGINPDSVKVTVNGKEYVSKLSNDNYLSVLIVTRGVNPQIPNGRATITVAASDWLGNAMIRTFSVKIDNALEPVGSPPTNSNTQGGSGRSNGPTGGGRAGGG